MYFVFLLVLQALSAIEAFPVECPYAQVQICGSDGRTYNDLCEWKQARLVTPQLRLGNLGPCRVRLYDQLDSSDEESKRVDQFLRGRPPKRKRPRSGSNKLKEILQSPDALERLANLQFNFRREDDDDDEVEE